ncbi:hypothetical protein BC936DRAFT_140563 [Jimgerdemannia flammicorona]|uniref:Uncharacterized protein n=1 Tax=Jimgerdemannia flammicorona TaxID=994334 RepID=A0A433AMT1_9FUNG|nr:hypothetical protein BC936DRAFT_140563 [Jimgerdemannia flammicorona]
MSVYPHEDQNIHERLFGGRGTTLLAPTPYDTADGGYLQLKPKPVDHYAPPSPVDGYPWTPTGYPSDYPSSYDRDRAYQSPLLTSDPGDVSSSYSTPEPVADQADSGYFDIETKRERENIVIQYPRQQQQQQQPQQQQRGFRPFSRAQQQQQQQPPVTPDCGWHGEINHHHHHPRAMFIDDHKSWKDRSSSPPSLSPSSATAPRPHAMAIDFLVQDDPRHKAEDPSSASEEDDEDSDSSDDVSSLDDSADERPAYLPPSPVLYHNNTTSLRHPTTLVDRDNEDGVVFSSFTSATHFRHRESSVRVEDSIILSGDPQPQLQPQYLRLRSPSAAISTVSTPPTTASQPLYSRRRRNGTAPRKGPAFRSPRPVTDPFITSTLDPSAVFHIEISLRPCLKRARDDDGINDNLPTPTSPSPIQYPINNFVYHTTRLSGQLLLDTLRARVMHSRNESSRLRRDINHIESTTSNILPRRRTGPRHYMAKGRAGDNNEEEPARAVSPARKRVAVANTAAFSRERRTASRASAEESAESAEYEAQFERAFKPYQHPVKSVAIKPRKPSSYNTKSVYPPTPFSTSSSGDGSDRDDDDMASAGSDSEFDTPRGEKPARKHREGRATSAAARAAKNRGPCTACKETKDTCIRKGYDWPFEEEEGMVMTDSNGKKYVCLCNKCGLRWQKSHGSICHSCNWILFKEERKKALTCIERMRRSRPEGVEIRDDDEIEGFNCNPKHWKCGRPWKVGWVKNERPGSGAAAQGGKARD